MQQWYTTYCSGYYVILLCKFDYETSKISDCGDIFKHNDAAGDLVTGVMEIGSSVIQQ